MLNSFSKATLLILTIFIACKTSGQSYPQDHPLTKPVSLEELQMKRYEKDTSASAVVLYDFGRANVIDGYGRYYIRYEYTKRIKIFKKSAYSQATFIIPAYYSDNDNKEEISHVKGITYNLEDGQIRTYKLAKDSKFTVKEDFHNRTMTITLPQVKEGSVIEFSYVLESPYPYRPRIWLFQSDIPVMKSEYSFESPLNLSYRIVNQGLSYLKEDDINEKKESTYYYWLAEDVPAFHDEPYINTSLNYLSMIHFELAEFMTVGMKAPKSFSRTWEDFDKALLKDKYFISAYDSALFPADFVKSIKAINTTDTLQKAKAAYQLVRQSVGWNGEITLKSDYSSLGNVISNKTGNSAEINLLLIGLLRELGIAANPVVLSTRQNGNTWQDFPYLSRFNYVIAQINLDGKNILLDATSRHLNFGMLPAHCMNGSARLVAEKNSRWIPIETQEKTIKVFQGGFDINVENTSVDGAIKISGLGYLAFELLESYAGLGKPKFSDILVKSQPNWESPVIEFKEFEYKSDTLTQPTIVIQTKIKDAFTALDDKIFLNPMLTEGLKSNPLTNPKRNYPVDLTYLKEENFSVSFKIPEGYTVDEMPKSVKLSMPKDGARFSYILSTTDGIIYLNSKIQLKKAIYSPEEYPFLREFYAQIVAKHAEQIVLKKK
ncbi:Transglutaminase-like superfamily protein [Pseudarcicella hirudinis]|uniref:Transglutaminase-like superfamily protein n=1 Tax=Pseudarcicella hirudinis TaxID=1079859 RepID=A0A1I5VYK1_9BACT|nr:DUF3857 domain-containing protein [Pseudarcicella hirudinis]SFQ12555.1 Transglutaminase-like superfamily protein [Pseudarcicella hirudinis]